MENSSIFEHRVLLLKNNPPTLTTGLACVVYAIIRLRAINRDKSRCLQLESDVEREREILREIEIYS